MISESDFCSPARRGLRALRGPADARTPQLMNCDPTKQGRGKTFSLPGVVLTFGGIQGCKDCSLLAIVNISRGKNTSFFHGKFSPGGDNIVKNN